MSSVICQQLPMQKNCKYTIYFPFHFSYYLKVETMQEQHHRPIAGILTMEINSSWQTRLQQYIMRCQKKSFMTAPSSHHHISADSSSKENRAQRLRVSWLSSSPTSKWSTSFARSKSGQFKKLQLRSTNSRS